MVEDTRCDHPGAIVLLGQVYLDGTLSILLPLGCPCFRGFRLTGSTMGTLIIPPTLYILSILLNTLLVPNLTKWTHCLDRPGIYCRNCSLLSRNTWPIIISELSISSGEWLIFWFMFNYDQNQTHHHSSSIQKF